MRLILFLFSVFLFTNLTFAQENNLQGRVIVPEKPDYYPGKRQGISKTDSSSSSKPVKGNSTKAIIFSADSTNGKLKNQKDKKTKRQLNNTR